MTIVIGWLAPSLSMMAISSNIRTVPEFSRYVTTLPAKVTTGGTSLMSIIFTTTYAVPVCGGTPPSSAVTIRLYIARSSWSNGMLTVRLPVGGSIENAPFSFPT